MVGRRRSLSKAQSLLPLLPMASHSQQSFPQTLRVKGKDLGRTFVSSRTLYGLSVIGSTFSKEEALMVIRVDVLEMSAL